MSILYLCGDWFQHTAARRRLGFLCPPMWYQSGFNTQPPEGGWHRPPSPLSLIGCFNTQPPEGGWRPGCCAKNRTVRFNTQPPEGGWIHEMRKQQIKKGFNTQPPEGGWKYTKSAYNRHLKFQHTAARRRLVIAAVIGLVFWWFQHTAARRRLARLSGNRSTANLVSTHSRPKAAGCYRCDGAGAWFVSTHSRPKAAGR